MNRPDRSESVLALALAAISFLLLTLELAQIRLFSYSLFPTVVYVAIAITLLGLGASGTVMAMAPRWLAADPRALAARAVLGFAITVPFAHIAFALFVSPRKVAALGEYPLLAVLLAGLTVPHFLLGLAIAKLLSGPPAAIHRRYFANLLGSSLGCLAFIPLLPLLGLERMILGVALGGALIAWALATGPLRRIAATAAIGLAIGLALAPRLLDFPPRYGQLESLVAVVEKARAAGDRQAAALAVSREYSLWDPVGRIEIHSLGDDRVFLPAVVPSRFYSQDGSNGSILIAFPADSALGAPFFAGTVYGAAYFPTQEGPPPDSVLAIGLGGGPDIFTALHYGARSVTGVEINQAAIAAIEGPMADFLGDPYHRPGVRIVCADGRGFLRRNTTRYDVIQLSGVDTGTALAPGSNVLAENYLYTREALHDLLGAIQPETGVVSILRFGQDALRLALIACEVLRDDYGATAPGQHLVVVGQGFWQNLLLKRTPFTPAELRALDAHLQRGAALPRVRIPSYEYLGFGLEEPLAYVYHPTSPVPSYMAEFWNLAQAGREAEIFARMPPLLRSVTDDRPFFFFNFFGELKPLVLFLLEIAALAAVFILLPLGALSRAARAAGRPRAALGGALAYFFALGAAYLVVEVVLMQRFVLFLGHPSYSISITLFALLLFSSLGAMAAGRTGRLAGRALPTIRAAIAAIVILVLLLALRLPCADPGRDGGNGTGGARRDRLPHRRPARLPDGDPVPDRTQPPRPLRVASGAVGDRRQRLRLGGGGGRQHPAHHDLGLPCRTDPGRARLPGGGGHDVHAGIDGSPGHDGTMSRARRSDAPAGIYLSQTTISSCP